MIKGRLVYGTSVNGMMVAIIPAQCLRWQGLSGIH